MYIPPNTTATFHAQTTNHHTCKAPREALLQRTRQLHRNALDTLRKDRSLDDADTPTYHTYHQNKRTSFPPLVTAVLITPKGAEPPGSRRIGVLGALVLILPSETV